MKTILLSTVLLCVTLALKAQPFGTPGTITKVTSDMNTLPWITGYAEYLPNGYDGNTEFPLIISMAGTGEGGDGTSSSLNKTIDRGPLQIVKNDGKSFEAVVICPQASGQNYIIQDRVKDMYDAIIAAYKIDLNRVYIIGFSAGGKNAVQFVDKYPETTAAVVAICPAATVSNPAKYLRTMPWWGHHNFLDGTVTYTKSRDNFMRISAGLNPTAVNGGIYPFGINNTVALDDYTFQMNMDINGDDTTMSMTAEIGVNEPKGYHSFTLYKNGGHDSWTKTFKNDAVWAWLFKQSKTGVITDLAANKTAKEIGISVFPNPSSETITIDMGAESLVSAHLLNTQGKMIASIGKTSELEFNVSGLSSGIYTLLIQTERDAYTEKVVVK